MRIERPRKATYNETHERHWHWTRDTYKNWQLNFGPVPFDAWMMPDQPPPPDSPLWDEPEPGQWYRLEEREPPEGGNVIWRHQTWGCNTWIVQRAKPQDASPPLEWCLYPDDPPPKPKPNPDPIDEAEAWLKAEMAKGDESGFYCYLKEAVCAAFQGARNGGNNE